MAGIAAEKCPESRASAGGMLKFELLVPCEIFTGHFLPREHDASPVVTKVGMSGNSTAKPQTLPAQVGNAFAC